MWLTQEKKKEIADGVRNYWDGQACDLFRDDKGRMDYSITFTRSEAFSMMMDFVWSDFPDWNWQEWQAMTKEERNEIEKMAFSCKILGY